MYLKITTEHLRRCAQCLQLCLKVPDPFDGQYYDDDEFGICRDCNEEAVAAIPDEYFQELAALSNASGDAVPADLHRMCPQALPTMEASLTGPNGDVQDSDVNEISDRSH